MKIFDGELGRPKYGKLLEALLDTMQVNQVLYVDYTVGLSGYVRVDVSIKQKGVLSFYYNYGHLEFSKDQWSELSDDVIMKDMYFSAKQFNSLQDYYIWHAISLLSD